MSDNKFESYSQSDLEGAYQSIDRLKYPEAFAACKAEIERRRTLQIPPSAEEIQQRAKHEKLFTKFVGIVLMVGGLLGYSRIYGSAMMYIQSNAMGAGSIVLHILFTALFTISIWAGWKLHQTHQDRSGLAKWILLLQTFSFSAFGFGYSFYTGLRFNVGYFAGRLGFKAEAGSDAVVFLFRENMASGFFINFAAIFFYVTLLKFSQRKNEN